MKNRDKWRGLRSQDVKVYPCRVLVANGQPRQRSTLPGIVRLRLVGTQQSEDDSGIAIPFDVNKQFTFSYNARTFRHFPALLFRHGQAPPAPSQEQPQAERKAEQKVTDQPEVAQAPPPPPPPTPPAEEAAPTPPPPQPEAPQPQPQELPKTATPYPLIGLSGLLSLGVFGLLRTRRSS